jgi:adenylate cyclase
VNALTAIFAWIGENEAVLSGIAAAIVIVGVLLTPIGRGLLALARGARGSSLGDPSEAGADASSLQAPPLITERPSIAVLPFANLSDDPQQEYLADGLSEDIITGLSRVKQFFVIARNTSFTYKGRAVDVQAVSRELGVRYVLEGSVRKLGDRVRVTAQLVDATTRGHTWAERFDRRVDEILEVDDEVTEAIIAALQPALRGAEAEHARRASPGDLGAWALVNQAWVSVQHDLGDSDTADQAISACEKALELDPHYAFAWAVLAHARSLRMEQKPGEADSEQTLLALQRALELGIDDPLVQHCAAAAYGNLGRTDASIRAWERSLELDPNSAGARAGLGIAQIYIKAPDRALGNIDAALRLSPRDPATYHWLAHRALACSVLGHWDEALAAAEESVHRRPSTMGWAAVAGALARAGRQPEARRAYEEFAQRVPGLEPATLSQLTETIAIDEASGRALTEALQLAATGE